MVRDDVSITHSWLSPAMGLVRFLYRFQYRRASALVAVTTGLADWARSEAPGASTFVIPNGANCEIFFPERQPIRATKQDYALFYGSPTRWHGIETMIAAVDNDPWPAGLDLVIVGDGQLGTVAQEVSARNVQIHALTSVPQETLAGYIAGATVGIVPINSWAGGANLVCLR